MKRIGLLFGQERAFPAALLARTSEIGGVTVEPVQLAGETLDETPKYDLVFDRISHDVAFYRSVLARLAVLGTEVVPDPRNTDRSDRFYAATLARKAGVPVPKAALLPSNELPENTTGETFANLRFPLNWEEIFAHVGFPAVLRPATGWRLNERIRVTSPMELFEAYGRTGRNLVVMEEELAADRTARVYVVGDQARAVPFDLDARRVPADVEPLPARVVAALERHGRTLAMLFGGGVLAFDFAVRGEDVFFVGLPLSMPTGDPEAIGNDTFTWLVDRTAAFLVERARGTRTVDRDSAMTVPVARDMEPTKAAAAELAKKSRRTKPTTAAEIDVLEKAAAPKRTGLPKGKKK